jgi:hypothetical protein
VEANPQASWAKINNTLEEAQKKITKAKMDGMNNWLPICNLELANIIRTVSQFE